MKKLKILFAAIAALCVIFFACSDDDDNNTNPNTVQNKMNFNNLDYELTNSVLVSYSKLKTESHSHLMIFHTSGISIPTTDDGYILLQAANGTGSGISFDIFSTSSEYLDDGVYTYDPEYSETAGTFSEGEVFVNYDVTADDDENEYGISSGTLTVKKITEGYEFELDCICEDGKKLEVTYKGIVSDYGILINYFYYEEEVYKLDKAILIAHKHDLTDDYIFQLGIAGPGIEVSEIDGEINVSGVGDYFYCGVHSVNPDYVQSRDYDFVSNINDMIEGKFFDANFATNQDPNLDAEYQFASGMLDIEVQGDEYTVEFYGVDQLGNRVVGFYIGIPFYSDQTHTTYSD